jgi:acetate---CoA ligase (ADP-forming)
MPANVVTSSRFYLISGGNNLHPISINPEDIEARVTGILTDSSYSSGKNITGGIRYRCRNRLPIVMEIVFPQILHKSDAGGVMVGLQTREEVTAAFELIVTNAGKFDPGAEINGVLIVKMAPPGVEVILGATRYLIFGPLLMFGFGGIFVEVFQDVEFRLAPMERSDAHQMIQGIKGYKLLQGFRGRPKADTQILEKMLVSISEMVMNHPEIKEMDINPLLVHVEGKGATAADCRIILEPVCR